jgi:glycosyltransferase involved in cell wall biosynthesis
MDKTSRKPEGETASPAAPKTPTPATPGDPPRQIIGRFLAPVPGNGSTTVPSGENRPAEPEGAHARTPTEAAKNGPTEASKATARPDPAATPATGKAQTPATPSSPPPKVPLAIFCRESQDSFIGRHVSQMVTALAGRGTKVHLFTPQPFPSPASGVRVHAVGGSNEGDLIDQTEDFGRRSAEAFRKQFAAGDPVAVIGYEWQTIHALNQLQLTRSNLRPVLSVHSLERQRSDLTGEMSRRIEALEIAGMRMAGTVLVHDAGTGEVARQLAPESALRTVHAQTPFPREKFALDLDPGQVKARYQIGPIDPTILFIGDLSEKYGPDFLVKAMPAVLRNHKQARLAVVGDGTLFWPLRVYARYLLLEHAVRLPGSIQDDALAELVRAADMIVVPSRESTPWWPILAGWAAGRPVIASHQAAPGLLEHQHDAVLIYPTENSCVWGIERLLYDPVLSATLVENGKKKLEERFGWNAFAAQIEELAGVVAAR